MEFLSNGKRSAHRTLAVSDNKMTSEFSKLGPFVCQVEVRRDECNVFKPLHKNHDRREEEFLLGRLHNLLDSCHKRGWRTGFVAKGSSQALLDFRIGCAVNMGATFSFWFPEEADVLKSFARDERGTVRADNDLGIALRCCCESFQETSYVLSLGRVLVEFRFFKSKQERWANLLIA